MRHVVLFGLWLGAVAGCDGLRYVTHVAEGQFGILGQIEPIDAVLASDRLTPDEEAKLALIVSARDYAATVMGLNAGDSYTTFYDTRGDPLAFNLSAARRDALVPVTWTFPFVGEVPYLAFFDEDYLRAEELKLTDAGYDTLTYEIDAYSTLGVFEDPVRSPMLQRNELSLADTVIHELLHNTIWRPGDTNFNESLATFVGRQGALEFLRATYGDESGWPAVAEAWYADIDRVNAFLRALYVELEAFYAEPLSSAEHTAGRAQVFAAARQRFVAEVQPTLNYPRSFAGYADLPTNNAWMLSNYRYNLDLGVFADVYRAVGEDWRAALAIFGQAAAADGDPYARLRATIDALGG